MRPQDKRIRLIMEFSLREWLIFVGIIVILGVLLDGYRRVRSGSRGKLKMSIGKSQRFAESEHMDYFNGELPNGGAREVNRSEDIFYDDASDIKHEPTVSAFDVAHDLRPDPLFCDDREPPMSEIFEDDKPISEPLAAAAKQDDVEPIPQPELIRQPEITPQPEAFEQTEQIEQSEVFQQPEITEQPEVFQQAEKIEQPEAFQQPEIMEQPETIPQPEIIVDPVATEQTGSVGTQAIPEQQPAPVDEKEPIRYQDVEEVIVMNVFAKDDQVFNGSELMRLVLACGMHYGDMNIFHRIEEGTAGSVQFSMANVVKPGTFDVDNMDNFYTPGVSFFLSLPGPKDSLKAVEYMYETALCVVKNLNGELKDEMHSAMTKQTIEHARQKVRDFQRRQLSVKR